MAEHLKSLLSTVFTRHLKKFNQRYIILLVTFIWSFVAVAVDGNTTSAPSNSPNYCNTPPEATNQNCSSSNLTTLDFLNSFFNNSAAVNILDLSYNHIQELTSNIFTNFSSLTVLHLEFNLIRSIDPHSFNGVINLTEVYLRGNQLTSINSTIFSTLPNLYILDISYNQLAVVTANTFQHLINLQRLNLEFNRITTLEHPNTFSGLQSLKQLNVAGNQLPYLQHHTFQTVSGTLLEINVSFTGLLTLYSTTGPIAASSTTGSTTPLVFFINMTNLLHLDVSNNQLNTINNGMTLSLREHMTNLVSFNVSHNPIICDCLIQDFLIWIKNLAFVSEQNIPLCFSPVEWLNVSLLNNTFADVLIANCTTHISDGGIFLQQTSPLSTKDPNISSMDPLPYDPMLGWYTAAFLFTILVLFILCLILDKLKRKYYYKLKKKLYKIEKQERLELKLKEIENNNNQDNNFDSESSGLKNGNANNNVDTPGVLCAVSVNTNNTGIATNDIEQAEDALQGALGIEVDILNKNIHIKKTRSCSISSNTSENMKLAEENRQRNILLCDASQPMLQATDESNHSDRRNSKLSAGKGKYATNSSEALELVPGVRILEINPECPLHGRGGKLGSYSDNNRGMRSNGAIPSVHLSDDYKQKPFKSNDAEHATNAIKNPSPAHSSQISVNDYPPLGESTKNQGAVPKQSRKRKYDFTRDRHEENSNL